MKRKRGAVAWKHRHALCITHLHQKLKEKDKGKANINDIDANKFQMVDPGNRTAAAVASHLCEDDVPCHKFLFTKNKKEKKEKEGSTRKRRKEEN